MSTPPNVTVDAPAPAAARGRLRRWHPAEWLLLVLAPPSAWWLFGVVLINQDGYIDPWFYLGYGRHFPALLDNFGWTYYAVRFPVVILNGWFLANDPIAGYAALRFVLVLLCGVPLYLWARAEFGRAAAAVAYVFLLCNPLLPRILLWDLTTFVSVPASLAGMALWLYSDRPAARAASGCAFMAAIASHAFTGTAVGTFLLVQTVRRLRAGRIRALLLTDVLVTACGAMGCFGLGYAYYAAQVGFFDPRVIVDITVTAARGGHAYAGTHSTPVALWAARESHVYVPLLGIAMAGALLGRRILHDTAPASVWWFAVAYTAAYAGYQFVGGRFVLETFYYFAHLTVAVFLLVPVIVGEATRSLPARGRLAAGIVAVAALVAVPLAEDLWAAEANRVVSLASGNAQMLAVLLGSAVVVALAAAWTRRPWVTVGALAAFLLCVQALVFLNPVHRRVFNAGYRARETGVYRAGVQLVDLYAAHSTPSARVMLWYCSAQHSISSIASTVLLFTVHQAFTEDGCSSTVGEYERARLAEARYVLIMDEHGDGLAARGAALRAAGYPTALRRSLTAGDDTYRAELRLVEIMRPQF